MEVPYVGVPRWRHPRSEEPAHGLLLHLAERNVLGSVRSVAGRFGIRVTQLIHGDANAIQRFASLIRCPMDRMTACTPIGMSQAEQQARGIKNDHTVRTLTLSLRNVPISRSHLFGRDLRRACPGCLSESRYHRFWWDLRDVTACPKHGIRLVDRCGCGSNKTLSWNDPAIFLCRDCKSTSPQSMRHEGVGAEVIAANRYLLSKFGGIDAPSTPMLDAMTFADAAETIHRVGAAAIAGYSKTPRAIDSLDVPTERILAEGYSNIANGKLQSVLQHLLDGFRKQAPQFIEPGLTTGYGWFYQWFNLKGGRRFSEMMADELLRHATKNFHLATPLRVSLEISDVHRGEAASLPRSYSLRAAATELGLPKTTLRRVGATLGLIRGKLIKGRVLKFDGDEVRKLAKELRTSLNLSQLRKRLGLPHDAVRDLVSEELLKPIIASAARGVFLFSEADVEAFLRNIVGSARIVPAPSKSLIDSARARTSLHIPQPMFFKLILSGQIRVVARKPGPADLASVLVDKGKLLNYLLELAKREDVSVGICATIIRGNVGATSALGNAGILKLTGSRTKGPKGRRSLISRSSISRFRTKYVARNEVVEILRAPPIANQVTERLLRARGIRPSGSLLRLGYQGYDRARVEKILPELREEIARRYPK